MYVCIYRKIVCLYIYSSLFMYVYSTCIMHILYYTMYIYMSSRSRHVIYQSSVFDQAWVVPDFAKLNARTFQPMTPRVTSFVVPKLQASR